MSMEKVKSYLDENYKEHITLELLSQKFYINKYYLTKIFKETYGAYSARTAHPFQRNGAPFRFKLSKAQQVD